MRKNKGEKNRRRRVKQMQQVLQAREMKRAYGFVKVFGVLASGQANYESDMAQLGALFGKN